MLSKPVAAGEARAVLDGALVELRPRLHRYCARMTGSVIDGEDVVQEVFVRAIEGHARAGPISSLEGWLFRIAHNVAINFLMKRARQNASLANEDPNMVSDPVNEIENRQIATASLRTFMGLSVLQRSSLILKDVLGYSLEEIGGITGTSLAATKANLHRGRVRLRELLMEAEDAPPPVLPEPEQWRLRQYVDRFNARDFDAVRDMLAEDVRLELVGAAERRGRGRVVNYFANYTKADTWRLVVGLVDRQPAILVHDRNDQSGRPVYLILLDWAGDSVIGIRDFTHARYAISDAEIIIAD